MSSDDERTVFGQRLPPQPGARPEPGPPGPRGPAPAPPQPVEGEKTVFGVRLPPQAPGQQPAPPQQQHPPAMPPHPPAGYAPPPQAPQPPPAAPPQGLQMPPHSQARHAPPTEDTWLGGNLGAAGGAGPGPGVAPGAGAQPPATPGAGRSPRDDTWLGGGLGQPGGSPVTPQPQPQPLPQPGAAAPPPPNYAPQYPQAPIPPAPLPPMTPQQPAAAPYQPPPPPPQGYGGYAPPPQAPPPVAPPGQPGPGSGQWTDQVAYANQQFPDPGRGPQPVVAPNVPKIAFSDALRGSGLDIGASSNPIIACASDLLVLLGRLRTGMVEMQPVPLRDHVVREIGSFVVKAQERGIDPQQIEIARYALAATADDVVQTIPGSDVGYWQQYSMAAELLNDRNAGLGFYARLDQVVTLPSQNYHLLELFVTCLALGFEGKFRTEPSGAVSLMRLRTEIYQRFRSVVPRAGFDISINWLPVILGGRRRVSTMPLWIVGGIAASMVVALFATLSWVLSNEAQASQNSILSLHGGLPQVEIAPEVDVAALQSSAAPEEEAPPPTPAQLDRIRAELAPEIEAGAVSVDPKGDYIAIRFAQLKFRSGSAELREDPTALIAKIGATLNSETGAIIVEGHSDSTPIGVANRYKTNERLSEARAQTVHDLLAKIVTNPERMSVVGRGSNELIDTANTREAHAKNRRVEVLVQKAAGN